MIEIYKRDYADKLKKIIGAELYEHQSNRRHICVPIDGGYFLAFRFCDVKNVHSGTQRCEIVCTKDRLIFFGNLPRLTELLSSFPKDSEPFFALAKMFEDMTSDDVDALDSAEDEINKLETSLISSKKQGNISSQIINLRRSLLKIKRYYEQLAVVLDRLADNENEIIPSKEVPLFEALGRYVHYLLQLVIDLREYVTQVREAYQEYLGIEQNNVMKIFTVITGVFLPLTLIVGWYGMNLKMPEFEWEYGYPFVVALSVIVCAGCFFLFKRKKWF